jgi:hypothetical protein
MESIGCFFLYPAFWLALFPGFWLVDGDWILSSHWCKRTLPSTGPRSDHLVTLLHLLRKCRKILPEVTSPEVTWPDITSQKWSRGHAQPFPVFFSYYSSSTKYTLGTHPSKGTPFGVTWLSVTSSSPVGHAQWYILYYYYSKKRKNAGNGCACARNHFRDVISGHATSGDVISGHVTSGDVTFDNIFLHFRSKWSKVCRWSDLGPVEGSALLHQWDDRIQPPSTNQKPGKRTNQKAGYKKKQPIDSIYLFLVWKDKFLQTKTIPTLKLVEICKDIGNNPLYIHLLHLYGYWNARYRKQMLVTSLVSWVTYKY